MADSPWTNRVKKGGTVEAGLLPLRAEGLLFLAEESGYANKELVVVKPRIGAVRLSTMPINN
jgi:hypothetical protein